MDDNNYLLDYQQYQAMILARYRHPYHGFRPWAQFMSPQPLSAVSVATATAKHLPHMPYGAAVAAISLPYLSQEPPVLQNPERVVRLSECERFEQSYQPNVALVPRVSNKSGSATTNGNGKERENDFDRDGDRDESDAIDMDVKIKKERPQTPSEESISPEPRIESPHLLASSLPPIKNPAPISPEGQSGSSNEITSSTSPVPASTTASHKPNEPAKTSPPPSSIENHHIHHLMLRSHHQLSKSSSGPLHQLHHGDSNNLDLHVSLTNGIYHHHHHQHHKANGVAGSSEFELSTDTDDDSLVGEADSSNNIATIDIAIEALKDTRLQEREKVLGIIKVLLQENMQINVKNAKLKQELRRKDDEIADLLQLQHKSHNDSTNSSQCSSNNANTTTTTTEMTTIKAAPEQSLVIDTASTTKTTSTTNPDAVVVAHPPAANITTATTIIEVGTGAIELSTTATNATEPRKKCETEVIRMPLKKSARRSPAEETLVIMQPHKLRDEARDKPRDKLDKILRYIDHTSKSPSPNPIQQSNLVTAKANEPT